MQTELPREYLATDTGSRADGILRSCVHCGFCNATCPTYQLLGDELDGPRGRIYLIKEMLESQRANDVAARHLDRCLTCRACETTCPSGVQYGELLEIGRDFLERERPRRGSERWLRGWLLRVVPDRRRFRRWARLGRAFRWLLPRRLAAQVPPAPAEPAAVPVPAAAATRRVLLLQGCVQQAATPEVNARLAELLAGRGIETVTVAEEGCCGALALHLGETDRARTTMAGTLDALAERLDEVEAVISTASGCGVTVKDYGRLLADDPRRAATARRLAELTVDAAEYLGGQAIDWQRRGDYRRVAWHSPCTLQHGQQVTGVVETLLGEAGYELVKVSEAHLCCGSAGSYSILQPELSGQLKRRKLTALEQHDPDVIATANVGCQLHLAGAAGKPVVHWLELLK
ncbi:MAG: glycolate oxidase subunit GlcF [Gammaproteobacteria bacterium]|nr:glycolate oxidase subunit GlcF [Gammaproteobacteria bacterium]